MMDAEGTSDVFIKGYFDKEEEVQETDTHYRNQDGKPDFQYRWIFKTEFPRPKNITKLTLEAFDRDFFKSNDMIGQATIDLADLMEDVSLVKQSLPFNQQFYDDVIKVKHANDKTRVLEFDKEDKSKIWLQFWGKGKKGMEKRGKVCVSINIMPQTYADGNAVGKARDNPNHSPHLPQPQGRMEFSLNPIKMLNQLVGPALRRKIYMGLCCAVCLFLFAMILPNLLSAAIVALI